MDCARAIVQSGVSRLVAYRPDITDKIWGEQFTLAIELFRETGVRVDFSEDDEAAKKMTRKMSSVRENI
jgi:deoxycytidylate deaminase